MEKQKPIPNIEEAKRKIKEVKENQLKELNLSGLNLTEIPAEVFDLKDLTLLELSQNQLTQLPKEIWKLKNLQALDLNHNQLTQLPKEIWKLKNLIILFLQYNQLTDLPKEIATLEYFRVLNLEGNDNLVSPPPSVVRKGIKAILNYLKALDEKINAWTSKMVLVGEGGVGKTCLLDALEDKDFNPNQDTTHGIDIRKLPPSVSR